MRRKQGIATLILLSLVAITGCSTTHAASAPAAGKSPVVDPQVAKGRQQLVDALDAAWIRVIASGKDREIYQTMPLSKPGAASSYMVTLADCLPSPGVAPFPDQPVGLLKEIETGKADLIFNPLSDLDIAGIKGFKVVNTWIVAGTPLWVVREDIVCPSDGNPPAEDLCTVIEP